MIIKLESPKQDSYSEELSNLMQEAIDSGDEKLVDFLRKLWDNESWESIQKKFSYEDSTWYVWWMDGVNALIDLDMKEHNG